MKNGSSLVNLSRMHTQTTFTIIIKKRVTDYVCSVCKCIPAQCHVAICVSCHLIVLCKHCLCKFKFDVTVYVAISFLQVTQCLINLQA